MAWDDIDQISWLKVPTVTDAFAKANQASESIGRNFLSGFRSGMEKQEQDILMPLKVQQAQTQLAKMGLEIAGEQIAQKNQLDTEAALVTLAGKMSTITDWKSPASLTAIEEVFRDNPVLGMTQPGQLALRQAQQRHQFAFELESKIQADKLHQQQMTARETAQQKDMADRQLALEKERQKGRMDIAKSRPLPNSPLEATRQITLIDPQLAEAEAVGDAALYNTLQTQKTNLQKIVDEASAPRGKAPVQSFDVATGQLKTTSPDVALSTSNRTLAERVVTQANVAKTTIDQLQRDISMFDIGPVGAAKNTGYNLAGLVMPGVGGSKAQEVQQNIKNLQGSINAMKTADRRGSIAELRAAGELIPKPGFALESAGHARNNLDKLVKNVLIPNARANAAQLGVRPPIWSLTKDEIIPYKVAGDAAIANGLSPTSPEFRSKFLTKAQARNILRYYEDNGYKMPNDIID